LLSNNSNTSILRRFQGKIPPALQFLKKSPYFLKKYALPIIIKVSGGGMKRAVSLLVIFLFSTVIWAQNRYALVIGNANYPNDRDKLPNAINDTNDISAALKKLGYEVILKQNLGRLDMVKEVEDFVARLRNNVNSEGFFWYAGHGIEFDGEGYLLPLDADMRSEIRVKNTSYRLIELTNSLNKVRNKANVLVLDACRVPPNIGSVQQRSTGDISRVIKSIPQIQADLMVIYSTAPGTTADDGNGRNSPFAEAFLKNINEAVPFTTVTARISIDTFNLTYNRQRPLTSGSFADEYYSLNPVGVTPSPHSPANMVRIEGGMFSMGSPSNEPGRSNDEALHRVTVSAFYIGKYQVTQAEYEAVMGTNPSKYKGANLPVENVSWYDAVEYCNRLSQREGLTPAYTIDKSRSDPNNKNEYDDIRWLVILNPNANGYRLPTEAEWEYACRAGTTTRFWSGNNETTLSGKANVADLTAKEKYPDWTWTIVNIHDGYAETSPVGIFAPNQWGLYDMHGNVWEWCWDWYDDYKSKAQINPMGAVSGAYRVIRGGSWFNYAADVRSAFRNSYNPSDKYINIGFRLVRQ